MDEELAKCRLCNYQSDKRLMLNVFDLQTEYCMKIENYLNLKICQSSPETFHFICFHCSQTLDNFHNFATKIKAIQKIIHPIVPQPQIHEQIFEIQVINESQVEEEEKSPKVFKVSTIRTRSHGQTRETETTFEELKKDIEVNYKDTDARDEVLSDQQSHRSFDFDENDEQFEETSKSDNESVSNDADFATLRDADDFDFPSAEALKKIPTKLIENGALIYKGKKLLRLISIFYNTSCKVCTIPKRFKSINGLFEHYKSAHSDIEPFVTCCSMQLKKMPKIIWHFVKHIEPDAFKCNLCDYAVSRPQFLNIHRQVHLPHGQKPLECDLCDKRFIWKGALKNHIMNHQSERKEFICKICNRKYQTAGSLATHRKSAHIDTANKTRKLCEICSKSFSTYTSYKEHLTLHSEDRDKFQLKCPECGKWLKNKRCLKSHLLLHTSDEKRCDLCDYVTKKEKLLKNHMITKHSDEKSFTCDVDGCDKSFKVKRALTIHKAQNHGGKSVARKCEFCSREFANSTNYYTHRKNLHAKELQEVLEKKKDEEKMKRIQAGLENVSASNVAIIEQTIFDGKTENPIIITLSTESFNEN